MLQSLLKSKWETTAQSTSKSNYEAALTAKDGNPKHSPHIWTGLLQKVSAGFVVAGFPHLFKHVYLFCISLTRQK